jgi:hypothetical protein
MIHAYLPQTLTPENLAIYIKKNSIEQRSHIEEIDLTPEEIAEFEHRSSAANRALDKLEAELKLIQEIFKKGTPEPQDIKIYPTKGIEALKANRKFADDQIEKGFREEVTMLYAIPVPEKKRIVYVTIEGEEFEQYSTDMTKDQLIAYTTLFSEDEQAATGTTVKRVTAAPSSDAGLDFLDEQN